jgi:hypothetical protein
MYVGRLSICTVRIKYYLFYWSCIIYLIVTILHIWFYVSHFTAVSCIRIMEVKMH